MESKSASVEGGAMKTRPTAVAFDVIETLFSLETLRHRLRSIGLPGETLETWFAQTLRDAFALDATEVYEPFREIASATLATLLAQHGCGGNLPKISRVLDGFAELSAHPDAATAFHCLRSADIRIVTLTNGSAGVTQKLLQSAGLAQFVERTISIEEIRRWKPRREVYLHAAKSLGVEPQHLALIATHAWDVHGASRAGLTTGFVARGKPFPTVMAQPDVIGETLADVSGEIVRLA
jgi:2-haloacid dehalogenase